MKSIVIGLDGAPWELIDKWTQNNELQYLSKIRDNGVSGVLKSTILANSSPALPSFYTGKNPAKTGIFGFTKTDGSLVTTKDIKEPTIWDLLDSKGYKQCITGLRATYPPPKINGVSISGVLDPTEDSNFVHPMNRKEEFKNYYPQDAFISKIKELGKNRDANKDEIYNYLVEITKNQGRIVRYLIENEKPDFSIWWIGYTDSIQHWFWDDKELVFSFFQEVDKIIGQYLNSYPDTNFIIMSDHGFGEAPEYNFNLNSWLAQEGYLKLKGGKIGSHLIRKFYSAKKIVELAKKIENKLNKESKDSNNENKLKVLSYPRVPGVDYNKSVAVFGTSWGIKILKENVANYDNLREELINKLKTLKGINGEKLVKEVWKREEIYNGRYENEVPDIIFLVNDKYLVRALMDDRIFRTTHSEHNWVGNHDNARDGIFLAKGPDIRDDGFNLGEAQIYDVMPTILHMYDIPIPSNVDGRVLKEIFKEDSELSERKTKYYNLTKEKESIWSRVRKLKGAGKI